MIPTPHISASQPSMIAETVLMPGDPLRAKLIAEKFLKNSKEFNSVRNMLGFTGEYQGKKVSVMGSGMGCPSMGIYSYELIHFYGVKNLVRIGSCGSFQPDLKVKDLVVAMSASTDSNYLDQYELPGTFAPTASFQLLERAVQTAAQFNIAIKVGNVLSSDVFYQDNTESWKKWAKMGVLAAEMEIAALYANAARANVNALGILTVSDSLVTHERLTAAERETSFSHMMELALAML